MILKKASRRVDDEKISAILRSKISEKNVILRTGRNNTYKVWSFELKPSWWQVWKTRYRVTVVSTLSDEVKNVYVSS